MVPDWVADYIGIPFADKGFDRDAANCWGLVRLVLADRFGVLGLPTYAETYETTRDKEALAAAMRAESGRDWVRVGGPDDWSSVRAGDVPLLRVRGLPTHVGIVVAPGFMLHAHEGTDSILARYDGLEWSKRIIGFYRHKSLIQAEIITG